MSKQSNKSGDPSSPVYNWKETLKKSLISKSDWPDKDELLDVVYWARQIIGAIIGVCWGLVPLYGIIGIALYLLFTTFIIHFYTTGYQNVDEEKLGGFWELAKEGFASAVATFMIAWILVYTAVHASTL